MCSIFESLSMMLFIVRGILLTAKYTFMHFSSVVSHVPDPASPHLLPGGQTQPVQFPGHTWQGPLHHYGPAYTLSPAMPPGRRLGLREDDPSPEVVATWRSRFGPPLFIRIRFLKGADLALERREVPFPRWRPQLVFVSLAALSGGLSDLLVLQLLMEGEVEIALRTRVDVVF